MTRTNWLCLTLFAALLALASYCGNTRAQTIPLSINSAVKCATARSGDNFTGVVDRACENVPPPPIDPSTLTAARVTYIGHGADESVSVNLLDWTQVFGRVRVTDPVTHRPLTPQPWVGAPGSIPQFFLPNNMQTCMTFTVPINTPMLPGIDRNTGQPYTFGQSHKYKPSGYNTGGGISLGLSSTCGTIPPPPCGKANMGPFDQGVTYRAGTGNAGYCGLAPGSVQVLTMKWTTGRPVEPTPARPICTGSGCKLAVQHN